MKITVKLWDGIAADVGAEVTALAAWLGTTGLQHPMEVWVVPAPAVQAPDGGIGFGVFAWPTQSPRVYVGTVRIVLAAGMAEVLQAEGACSRADALDAVLHTVAHEWAHYEQWRDGRQPTERGVNKRATHLLHNYTTERQTHEPSGL
jgi:hypothetical protein